MGVVIAITALLGAELDAAAIARLEHLAPHACGLCLAEIIDLKEIDARPMDGNLYVCASLREIRGSGKRQNAIGIVKEWGGYRQPGSEVPEIKPRLQPDSLTKGQAYWFAFCSPYMRCIEGIVDFWPKGAPEVDELFNQAVEADHYLWQPQYHPETEITYGHLALSGKDGWRIRVQNDGKTLWEKVMSGAPSPFLIREGIGIYDRAKNPSRCVGTGFELWAETAVALSDGNEYQIPAGKYHLSQQFDLEKGNRVAAEIFDGKSGATPVLFRVYDAKTGRRSGDQRYEYVRIGGRFFGGEHEGWLIKVEQTYDPDSGALVSEELYRHGKTENGSSAWISMDKRVPNVSPP